MTRLAERRASINDCWRNQLHRVPATTAPSRSWPSGVHKGLEISSRQGSLHHNSVRDCKLYHKFIIIFVTLVKHLYFVMSYL